MRRLKNTFSRFFEKSETPMEPDNANCSKYSVEKEALNTGEMQNRPIYYESIGGINNQMPVSLDASTSPQELLINGNTIRMNDQIAKLTATSNVYSCLINSGLTPSSTIESNARNSITEIVNVKNEGASDIVQMSSSNAQYNNLNNVENSANVNPIDFRLGIPNNTLHGHFQLTETTTTTMTRTSNFSNNLYKNEIITMENKDILQQQQSSTFDHPTMQQNDSYLIQNPLTNETNEMPAIEVINLDSSPEAEIETETETQTEASKFLANFKDYPTVIENRLIRPPITNMEIVPGFQNFCSNGYCQNVVATASNEFISPTINLENIGDTSQPLFTVTDNSNWIDKNEANEENGEQFVSNIVSVAEPIEIDCFDEYFETKIESTEGSENAVADIETIVLSSDDESNNVGSKNKTQSVGFHHKNKNNLTKKIANNEISSTSNINEELATFSRDPRLRLKTGKAELSASIDLTTSKASVNNQHKYTWLNANKPAIPEKSAEPVVISNNVCQSEISSTHQDKKYKLYEIDLSNTKVNVPSDMDKFLHLMNDPRIKNRQAMLTVSPLQIASALNKLFNHLFLYNTKRLERPTLLFSIMDADDTGNIIDTLRKLGLSVTPDGEFSENNHNFQFVDAMRNEFSGNHLYRNMHTTSSAPPASMNNCERPSVRIQQPPSSMPRQAVGGCYQYIMTSPKRQKRVTFSQPEFKEIPNNSAEKSRDYYRNFFTPEKNNDSHYTNDNRLFKRRELDYTNNNARKRHYDNNPFRSRSTTTTTRDSDDWGSLLKSNDDYSHSQNKQAKISSKNSTEASNNDSYLSQTYQSNNETNNQSKNNLKNQSKDQINNQSESYSNNQLNKQLNNQSNNRLNDLSENNGNMRNMSSSDPQIPSSPRQQAVVVSEENWDID